MKGARALVVAFLALALGGAATAADRSKPPAPGSIKPLKLPPIQRSSLANGLTILLLERHQVPTVELVLLIKAGAAADPLDRPGTAAMTADILDESAGGKDALALADALDLLGADLTTSASWDASIVRMHVPVARLKSALPVMADVALRPSFRSKDLERLRKEALTSLLQARDEPRQVALAALERAVFGEGHRYGRPEAGDAKSVAALKLSDLRTFYGKYYKPTNAVLVVVGDVDASVVPLVEKAFGQWSKGGGSPAPVVPDPPR